MPKYANIVTVDVRAGEIDRVLAALLAHKERSLRDEPGTLQFEILRPHGADSRLMTYEVYHDETSFEAHRAAPSLAQLLKESGDAIAALDGTRCTLVD